MRVAKYHRWLLSMILGFACAFCAAKVPAALIEANHPTFGPSSLTIDEESHLAWLDLTFTIGQSFVDVIAQTGPGGQFEGFRPATDTEAVGLFLAAGIPNIDASEFDFAKAAENIGPAQALIALIGQTTSQDGYPEAHGFLATIPPFIPGAREKAELDFFLGNGTPGYLVGPYGGAYNETIAFPSIGTFLVQAIPEASTLVLAVFAIAAVTARRGKPAERHKSPEPSSDGIGR